MTEVKRPKKKSLEKPVLVPAGQNDTAQNEGLDPAVIKLIDYAKSKKELFFEELAD